MTDRNTMLARTVRRVAGVFADIQYAQHKLDAIRMNPDSYSPGGDKAPELYADFLFRTSGALLHEPTADRRARGQLVS